MERKVLAFCREWSLFPEGSRVLCAVSGGADSMCLLHWLDHNRETLGIKLQAAHYNHRLRGEESDRDEEFVRAYCRERNIPLLCGGGDVAARAEELGRGVEETAREMRYAFLQDAARQTGADRIAVAHHADDNVETMLLHLIRGSGLTGLVGMQPRRDNIVRPLLSVTRAETESYCNRFDVPHVFDSTNADDDYLRNRLRHRVIPQLTDLNPRFVENSVKLLGRLREDERYLQELTRSVLLSARQEDDRLVIPASAIAELPQALAPRAVRLLLEQAGMDRCSAAHLESVIALCRSGDPSARVDLPGLTVCRRYGEVFFSSRWCPTEPPEPVAVQPEGRTAYGDTGWTLTCRQTVCPKENAKNPASFFLARDKINGTLVLRPRRTGDSIKLPGRGTKTVKKLLIDEKVPLADRDLLPVLADDVGVLALAAFGPDESHLAQPGEPALIITLEKERST